MSRALELLNSMISNNQNTFNENVYFEQDVKIQGTLDINNAKLASSLELNDELRYSMKNINDSRIENRTTFKDFFYSMQNKIHGLKFVMDKKIDTGATEGIVYQNFNLNEGVQVFSMNGVEYIVFTEFDLEDQFNRSGTEAIGVHKIKRFNTETGLTDILVDQAYSGNGLLYSQVSYDDNGSMVPGNFLYAASWEQDGKLVRYDLDAIERGENGESMLVDSSLLNLSTGKVHRLNDLTLDSTGENMYISATNFYEGNGGIYHFHMPSKTLIKMSFAGGMSGTNGLNLLDDSTLIATGDIATGRSGLIKINIPANFNSSNDVIPEQNVQLILQTTGTSDNSDIFLDGIHVDKVARKIYFSTLGDSFGVIGPDGQDLELIKLPRRVPKAAFFADPAKGYQFRTNFFKSGDRIYVTGFDFVHWTKL